MAADLIFARGAVRLADTAAHDAQFHSDSPPPWPAGCARAPSSPLGVVALVLLVALGYLQSGRPWFSFTGTSARCTTASGPSARGSPMSCSSCSAGRPILFPVMLGASCWVLFRRGQDRADVRASIPRCASAGFVLVLVASCGLATLHWERGLVARRPPAASSAALVGQGLAVGPEFPRAPRCCCSPPGWPACRWRSAFPGSPIIDRIGAACLERRRLGRGRAPPREGRRRGP